MKALLIEDDKILSDQIKRRLEDLEFDVYQAFDGEEAVGYLDYDTYDIIILDLMLPKIHGYQILEKIKNKEYQNSSSYTKCKI